jgi:integrase
MSRPRTKLPAYRHYKPKNLAVVRINGKDHYLGQYGTVESHERYHRLIAEWLAQPACATPPIVDPSTTRPPLTISELIWKYWTFVQVYYRKNDEATSEQHCIRSALRPLRRLFGQTSVADFGPRSLKLVREHMIAASLCRTTINKYVFRVKRLFEWGVEQELVDVRIHQSLKTVHGLAKGRTQAAERPPVRPVALELINATLPHLSPNLQAMIHFQRLTGCRPTEACLLRPCDIDMSGPVWCYRPSSHKTEHHGMERRIFIGPAAQQFLRPYLERPADAYCFSPRESRRPKRSDGRATHTSGGPTAEHPRRVGLRYTRDSYRRAIARACEKAEIDSWSPNQLRHLRATEIRSEFGLESSQTVLGHSRADTTQIYAERNFALAENVMGQFG